MLIILKVWALNGVIILVFIKNYISLKRLKKNYNIKKIIFIFLKFLWLNSNQQSRFSFIY